MAEKPKDQAETTEQTEQDGAELEQEESTAKRASRRILKFIGVLLVLTGIVLAGFFAGIYLRVLDVYEVNEKIDLYALPFIGENFVEPAKKAPGFFDEYVFQPTKKLIEEKLSSPPPEEPPPEEEKKPEEGKLVVTIQLGERAIYIEHLDGTDEDDMGEFTDKLLEMIAEKIQRKGLVFG